MLSVIRRRGSGRITAGENEIAQLFLLHDMRDDQEQTKRKLCISRLFDDVTVVGGEFFVLAVKMKRNDFWDKNLFLPDAVIKTRSEILLQSPIKNVFDV